MNDAFKTHMLNEQGRGQARNIARLFDETLVALQIMGVDGRNLAIVTTKLEEACFFAKKSIAVKPENQESP